MAAHLMFTTHSHMPLPVVVAAGVMLWSALLLTAAALVASRQSSGKAPSLMGDT